MFFLSFSLSLLYLYHTSPILLLCHCMIPPPFHPGPTQSFSSTQRHYLYSRRTSQCLRDAFSSSVPYGHIRNKLAVSYPLLYLRFPPFL